MTACCLRCLRRLRPGLCRPSGADAAARQRGAVTAELAVALVPVAVLLLLGAWLAAAGTAQVRVQLAAGAAARALARGEDPAVVAGRVAEQVDGAATSTSLAGDVVRVEVAAPLAAPLLGRVGVLTGSAVVPVELVAEEGP